MTASKWRQAARDLIEATLAQLPPTATRKDAQKALRAVSPYAQRFPGDGLSWGSQCWYRERNLALNRRWPPPPASCRVRVHIGAVVCDWCEDRVGGCLACAVARAFLADLPPEGLALLAAADQEPEARGIFADWLEENGRAAWAAQWREPPCA